MKTGMLAEFAIKTAERFRAATVRERLPANFAVASMDI
jgi:hypothetical protein